MNEQQNNRHSLAYRFMGSWPGALLPGLLLTLAACWMTRHWTFAPEGAAAADGLAIAWRLVLPGGLLITLLLGLQIRAFFSLRERMTNLLRAHTKESRLEEQRLQSLLRISQHQAATLQELLDFALNEVIALSGSSLGYIYYYDEDKQEFTLHSWSREVMAVCRIPNPERSYRLEKTGIWGEAVRQRQPIVVNDFQAPHPLKKGYPAGHAPLHRFMTIPVFQGERIVAVVGVANKPTDYTDLDLLQLRLMTDAVWKIAEREQTQRALRESDARFRDLIEKAPAAISIARSGRIIYANPNYLQMFGFQSPEELTGRPILDLIAPECREMVQQRFLRREQRPAAAEEYESIGLRKDDGRFPIHVNVARVTLADGPATIGFLSDITERKRAEAELERHRVHLEELVAERTAELAQSEERYRLLFDSGKDAIFVHGVAADGSPENFIEVNRVACERLGYSRAELLGLSPARIGAQEAVGNIAEVMNQLERRGHAVFESVHITKTGQSIPVEINAHRFELGDKLMVLSIARDITERRQMMTQLGQARDAAEAANRAKSAFLANMSHEIRTPMNAILGFSQVMRRDPALTAQQKKHLDIINQSGEHLLALINDVLEISKIEAGRVHLHAAPFNLQTMLRDLEAMFRLRTDAKSLQLQMTIDEDVPSCVIGDEGKLRQIFINLLGNAVKFTRNGGIAFRLRLGRREQGRLHLAAEVEDTGPGIAPEEIGRLFQAFEQSAAGRQSGDGTGLGLAISRQFARMMGGEITVASQVGLGSCFSITFELEQGEAAEPPQTGVPRRVAGLRPGQGSFTILVVDDKAENRELLAEMLRAVGFETWEAADGQQAIELCRQRRPHLIMMDLSMPVMDGYEAIREIKASPEGRRTPIIAVTASAFEENRQKVLECGADRYLRKPFQERELYEAVQACLGVHYVFEEDGAPTPVQRDEKLQPLILQTAVSLPEGLVDQMREAATLGDYRLLLESIDRLAEQAPQVAERLRELAQGFQYETLLRELPASLDYWDP